MSSASLRPPPLPDHEPMPAESPKDAREDIAVAVQGVLCVGPVRSGRRVVHLGPAAGWMVPAGIARWEQELSFIGRADMTAQLAKALHATLPHEQIAPKRFGTAASAVGASPLLAMSSNLVEAARKEGVRVHTVGVDRVSADFYYFADGGAAESVRVQGNLVEMLADHVDSTTTNAEIEALQASLINRLLSALSDGIVSELEVELADAMPRLSRDGTGLVGTDLERFEAQAAALAAGSTRFEAAARKLAEALATAAHAGQTRARVPLYGEAQREKMPPLEVRVGDRPLRLPECFLWTVSGTPHEEARVEAAKPAPRPVAGPAPVRDRAAAQPEVVAPQPTKPEVAAPVRAKSEVIAPVQAKSEVVAPQSVPPAASEAAKAAVVPAATPKGEVKAPPAGTRAPTPPAAAKPSALVPVFLLLGLAASLYFLWRSLPW